MTEEFVIVEDGCLVGHGCGLRPEGKDCRDVPNFFTFVAGRSIKEYDKAWQIRPLADRIADGLVVVSEAEKIVGETVVAKDRLERIRDGLDSAPKGEKIVEAKDGTLSLEPMSLLEQAEAGQISRETAEALQALAARADRTALLSSTDWTQAADSPLSADDRALWAVYRQALRDIPAQGGFPWIIEWPARPDRITA
jgi:hypothetical protein